MADGVDHGINDRRGFLARAYDTSDDSDKRGFVH
jgi:hypothetical protein